MAAHLFWNEPLDTVLENAYCALSGDTRQSPWYTLPGHPRLQGQLLDDPLKDLKSIQMKTAVIDRKMCLHSNHDKTSVTPQMRDLLCSLKNANARKEARLRNCFRLQKIRDLTARHSEHYWTGS